MEASSGSWPQNGEIDIIESVNNKSRGSTTLHTSDGCTQSAVKGGFSGSRTPACISEPCPPTNAPAVDCYIHAAGQRDNQGCGIQPAANRPAYGPAFNAAGGGVYAFLWTHSGERPLPPPPSPPGTFTPVHDGKMEAWFFDRQHIPPNLQPHLRDGGRSADDKRCVVVSDKYFIRKARI